MHLISIGLFLLTLNVINANQYDPNEPLIAEASQHQSQFASAADINSVSARFPARFQAASSVSGHVNGKPFGAGVVNNNGAVSRFATGDAPQNYWWMNMADSPFKRAEASGVVPPCSLSAGCTAASTNVNLVHNGGQQLDLSKNPFLNGIINVAELPEAQRYQQQQQTPQAQQTVFIHSDSAAGCTHASHQAQQPQALAQVSGDSSYYVNNPTPVVAVTAKPIDSSQVYVNSVNEISSYDNGFTSSKSQYNSQRDSGSQFISVATNGQRTQCQEQGRICAPKNLCQNGLVRSDQLSLLDDSRSECDAGEVCCKIYYDNQPGRPFNAPQTIRCRSGNQKCVPAYQCVNGELTSEGLQYAARLRTSQTCQSPNVCCSEARSYDSLPAAANSNQLTPEGYVIAVPDRRYLPSLPEEPDRVPAPDTQNDSKLSRPTSPRPTQPPTPPRVPSTTYLPQTQPTRPVQPISQRPIVTSPRPAKTTVRDDERVPQPANEVPAYLRVPSACAAAMNCTRKEFCTAAAMISKTAVVLTPDQELFRVPMTACRIKETGEDGFCCRDPDYVDPWPTSVLGQYRPDLLGFDDGSYKPEASQRNTIKAAASQVRQTKVRPGTPLRAAASSPNSVFVPRTQPQQPVCGIRDRNTEPKGLADIDANFAEFPWQVMVLRESTKTLLCGGVIVGPKTAIVTAKCVQGQRTNDVLIKSGEWQLGTNVEPRSFQIVRVKSIQNHPQYNPSTLEYDVAILHLEENIKFDIHVQPICLDENEQSPLDNCVTTGWGKEVLKVHAQDAIMHYTDVFLMSQDQCSQYLSGFNADCSFCGQTKIDACQVDPGSALACQRADGNYVLKGVYSTETECNSPSQLTTFTKIDTNWVKKALNPSSAARQVQVAAAASPREVRVRPDAGYLPPRN